MKTKYKYIHFIREKKGPDAKIKWLCRTNRTNYYLAKCWYYHEWNKYVISFFNSGIDDCLSDIVLSDDCLTDIAHFLQQLNEGPKP